MKNYTLFLGLCLAFFLSNRVYAQPGLQVLKGTNNTASNTGGYAWIGNPNSLHLSLDNNEIQARSGNNANTLFLNYYGGNISLVDNNNNANGNVGIGTSSPQSKVHIKGDGGILSLEGTNQAFLEFYPKGYASGQKGYIGYSTAENNNTLTIENSLFDIDVESSNFINLYAGEGIFLSSVDDVAIAPEENIILNPNGRVGILTSSPADILTIDGTGFDNNGSSAVLGIISGNGAQRMLFDGNEIDALADGLFINNNTDENIILANGGGRVTVGTDTSPDFLLEVTGSAGKPGGGSWSNSSDRRLKKDIEDFKDGLEQILEIRPVWYRYNGMYGLPTEERYVGIIAQEMQEVAPYTITPYIETDDETGEQAEYLSYDGTAVTYMLVNAVQEQQEIIEAVKKENKELKDRLAKIEALLFDKDKKANASTSSNSTILTAAKLLDNQPNPFSEGTTLRYFIPENVQNAALHITNTNGETIKVININQKGQGQVTLEAYTLSAGNYFYSLVLDGKILETKQMILVK
ncbi:MAG: tail fiber domain-containing protein [Bacteroidota bacterium]